MKNPGSLFLAGDTAQTIASGVRFRFQDVKSLLWNESLRRSPGSAPTACVLRSLSQNFRSHNGLVAASAALSGILQRLFPSDVDHAEQELGFFQGQRPLVMTASSISHIVSILLDADKDESGSLEPLDFGANQVIIVRSPEARERLYAAAPELKLLKAVVLTIVECKGLEFNDAFLVNLCADSPAQLEWRVLARAALELWDGTTKGALSDDELIQADRHLLRPLDLDPRAHAALVDELKLLYVAVTRARRRLCFFDTDATARAPLFAFLTSPRCDASAEGGLLPPLAVVGDRPAARQAETGGSGFAQASSAEEWMSRGAGFSSRGLYAQAAKCFTYAGNEQAAAAAHAEVAQADAADAAALGEAERRRARLLEAGLCYLRAGAPRRAAECLRAAGEAALAGELEGE